MNAIAQQRTMDNEERAAVPPCPHFGPCGGCQLQHLTYSAQLAGKATRLRALLDATSLALPELQLHPSPPLAYRNRIRLTLAEVAGQLRAGYLTSTGKKAGCPTSGSRSPDVGLPTGTARVAQPAFLPVTQCPIAAPILWRAAEALLTLLNDDAAYWLRSPQFKLDQLELFTAAGESALQLTLYLRTAAKSEKSLPAKFAALCDKLRAGLPQLVGAGIAILPPLSSQRSRRTEAATARPHLGRRRPQLHRFASSTNN
jgi:23S rRNA (uracil1939-C5)-methyltransferase